MPAAPEAPSPSQQIRVAEQTRECASRAESVGLDAYGTLFDVHSVIAECEALFPGKGASLSQLWRGNSSNTPGCAV